jgi:hypothetical protein
VSDI